jgi:hypothetical protein
LSPASILKQQEALMELDHSIDDWVTKLEQAENRRTRVRQKLLEHVAAALTIPPSAIRPEGEADGKNVEQKDQLMGITMDVNRDVRIDETTSPHPPTTEHTTNPNPDTSPERLALSIEAHTTLTERLTSHYSDTIRMSKESIRIYADSMSMPY